MTRKKAPSPDPAAIAKEVVHITKAIAEHKRATDALTERRTELVTELRKAGWSFGKIADATGLSRSRVAQIAPGT